MSYFHETRDYVELKGPRTKSKGASLRTYKNCTHAFDSFVDYSCRIKKWLSIYTHGNKLGNTYNNVTTNFGLYIHVSFFVKIMKNVSTICQNL